MSMRVLYVLGVALAYAAVFVTGRKLRGHRKGTGGVVLAAHKLVSVCAVGLVGLVAYRASAAAPLGMGEWATALVAGGCWLASAASGGVAARQEAPGKTVRSVHRAASALAVVASAAALVLLSSRL